MMAAYSSFDTADKVWYFAYGSNMKSSVMERRGMQPFAVKRLVIPSHILTFDIFGVPYTEPAMASIAERETVAAGRGSHQPPPSVHGIGYLLSARDFKNLVVSEGAGTAYAEVELQAQLLGASHGDDVLPVRTLVSRFPFRPNPLPSARYLGLLIDGAEEHGLPVSYRDYLASLPSYTKSLCTAEAFGARLFLGFWMPIITWSMKRIKTAAAASDAESGRSNSCSGVLVWLLFNAVWLHYDLVHCRVWGRGGGRL